MSTINELNKQTDDAIAHHSGTKELVKALLKAIALHVDQHNDVMPVQYLVDRLGKDDAKGLNTKAIGDWINAYTKATVKYSATEKRHLVTFNKNKTTIVNMETAKKAGLKTYKEWFDFRPTTVSDEYSLQKLLQAQLSKANQQLAKKTKLIADGQFDEAGKIDVTIAEVSGLRLFLASLIKGEVAESVVESVELEMTGS